MCQQIFVKILYKNRHKNDSIRFALLQLLQLFVYGLELNLERTGKDRFEYIYQA